MHIIKPGLFSTFQDLGRVDSQNIGMPVGGVMDAYAMQMANVLVGNQLGEACLETTMQGPALRFNAPALVAITGGQCRVTLNDEEISLNRSFLVNEGDVLELATVTEGLRSYLAVAGGFDIPMVMGSKSTYLRGGIGGWKGRALLPDDVIPLNTVSAHPKPRKVKGGYIPRYPKTIKLRIIAGPERTRFTKDGIYKFLTETYELSPQSDRMGYRFKGPCIGHQDNADIISSGVAMGTIQVPGEGQPIIMMADRQTTGGYTRIAHVIAADLYKLAQMKPGDKVRFVEVHLDEAHRLLREQQATLDTLCIDA